MPRPSFTSLVCAVTGNLKGEKGSVTSPKEVIIEVLGPAFSLKNLKCMYFFLPNPSMPTHPLCLFYSSGSPRGSRSQVCLGGLVDCRVRREIGFKTWIRFWVSLSTQGVEWLALFPQWEHHISASKDKKEPWCSGFRTQEWRLGAFQGEGNMGLGTVGEACACGCYDLVLLLHLCALPVFREQWQYSVKLPFLIWLKVCISFLAFEFFSRKEKKKRAHFTVGCANIKTVLREMKTTTTTTKTPFI